MNKMKKKLLEYKVKNRYLVYFVLCGLVLGSFFGSVGVNSAVVVIVVEGFDTYAEGVSSGSNSWVDWEGDTDFVTSTTYYKSAPMSLKGTMSADSNCYINVTNTILATGFEFWFYYSATQDNAISYVNVTSDSSDVVRFRIRQQSAFQDVAVYDYNAWAILGTGIAPANWYCIGFQGNYSASNPVNYVYYYVENSTEDIIHDIEKRWISLIEYSATEIDAVLIHNEDNVPATFTYFDSFILKSGGATGADDEECNVEIRFFDFVTGYPLIYYPPGFVGAPWSPSYDGGYLDRPYVSIGGVVAEPIYTADGAYSSCFSIDFVDGLNDIRVYSYGGGYSTGQVERKEVSWKTNYSTVLYNGQQLDIGLIRSTDITTSNLTVAQTSYYEDLYGKNVFFEFVGRETDGYYHVGQNPWIVYNLSWSDVTSGNTGLYYEIWRGIDVLYYEKMHLPGHDISGIFREKSFKFPAEGFYHLKLYEFNDTTLLKGALLYTSYSITVGAEIIDPGDRDVDDIPFVELDEGLSILIGVFASIGLGVGLLMVTGNAMVMFVGIGAGAYLFSIPGLGAYQLLPPEVGMGLIVLLVLIAVIVWLLGS